MTWAKATKEVARRSSYKKIREGRAVEAGTGTQCALTGAHKTKNKPQNPRQAPGFLIN